jgi:hypothetical protein
MMSSMVPPTLAEVEAIVPPIADVDYVDVDKVLWGPICHLSGRRKGCGFGILAPVEGSKLGGRADYFL